MTRRAPAAPAPTTRPRSAAAIGRDQLLRYRVTVQQLDLHEDPRRSPADAAVLDLGVQDTGPDGAPWALALRGVPLTSATASGRDLVLAWTVRGAPHLYRRSEVRAVARAVAPLTEADARMRVYDAAKPLTAAGLPVAQALTAVATAMRAIVTGPMVKGEVSTRLTAAMPDPYLRWCASCGATHLYEMPFRLAALHAGLVLEPGTSPPVLRRLPRWPTSHTTGLPDLIATPARGRDVPEHLDVVRAHLHLLGPARPADVAGYLDAPKKDVAARIAELVAADEVVRVQVDGEDRFALRADLDLLAAADGRTVRLLGPFDLLLQARDRELLVPDAGRRRALWPVLGRPGAVLVDGEVAGTWRARTSNGRLTVTTDPWVPWARATTRAVGEQAERLARYRGVELTAVG